MRKGPILQEDIDIRTQTSNLSSKLYDTKTDRREKQTNSNISQKLFVVSSKLYNLWIIIFYIFPLSSKSHSDKFKTMAWGFTTLCQCQEFHRQKLSKDINDPNGSTGQLDLIKFIE